MYIAFYSFYLLWKAKATKRYSKATVDLRNRKTSYFFIVIFRLSWLSCSKFSKPWDKFYHQISEVIFSRYVNFSFFHSSFSNGMNAICLHLISRIFLLNINAMFDSYIKQGIVHITISIIIPTTVAIKDYFFLDYRFQKMFFIK